MIIIGERLNSSRKSVLEALQYRDREFVCEQAKKTGGSRRLLYGEIQATIHAAAALLGQDASLKSYLRFSRAKAKADQEGS
jgi:hypothetical protein